MDVRAWFRGLGRRGGSPGATPLPERVPYHVGIIMDGNGRWAARRRLPVQAGHRAGTKALKRTIKAARRLGVRQLSIYTFSTENWSRPDDEVSGLMSLLEEMLDSEVAELAEQGVKIVFVGQLDDLSAGLRRKIREAEERTADNDELILFVAFNYGGRAEIVDALRSALANGATAETLREEDIARHLYAAEMCEPDLIIRTSGEFRLSNFLLWQSAYAELHFSDLLWPDFDEAEFERAIRDFAARERRYGSREPSRGS
jgi:undecaprenyl diphosphate synthase